CLAKNPAGRPQSASELAARFREKSPPAMLVSSAPAVSVPGRVSNIPPASAASPPIAPTTTPPESATPSPSAAVSSATQSPRRKLISKPLLLAGGSCLVVILSALGIYSFRGRSPNTQTE